jgi:adhesin transport system outer membrane protein
MLKKMQKISCCGAILSTTLLLAATFVTPVAAQVPQHLTLKDAAQAAVLKSPEVLARWHAFQEASEEIDVARGGFLPKVDVSANMGRDDLKQPSEGSAGSHRRFTRSGGFISLNQMLFDGFATSSEVKRLGKAKLVRYFELLDASENIALEAGRAYLDVVRQRYLVFLAEENYIQHQAALDQLRQRAESGVGKRVDVEQAASRLALADVNLTTAYANLHDVTARYVRLVGTQPARVMFAPAQLAKAMPGSTESALQLALKHNPALRASVENIEAAQFDLEGRRASFMPRLDLRARNEVTNNYLGFSNTYNNAVVEAVVSYNLFNGGSDAARNRQYRERKNIALDQREKACRDMRQTLSIAFNETLRLNDQLSFIGLQVNLVEKTRTAYRDQFNIGQRTLLDLLNTQNEYFDARRSQVNADFDLSIAYLRSYAGMGSLLEQLGLKKLENENSPDEKDLANVDQAQLCPPTAPTGTTLDREALGRKAKELIDSNANSFVASRPLATAEAPAPVSQVQPVAPTQDSAPNSGEPTGAESEVSARITEWGSAWASRDAKSYLAFYAPEFVPDGGLSRETWARQREQRLGKAVSIRLEMQNMSVRMNSPNTAFAVFRQIYVADGYRDTTEKTLEWRKENGQWQIVRESVRADGKGR